MATVITLQPSPDPTVNLASAAFQQSRRDLSSDPHNPIFQSRAQQMTTLSLSNPTSSSSLPKINTNITSPTGPSLGIVPGGPRRDGASCDACIQRKSRCAINQLINKCYSCDFHRQSCTFNVANAALLARRPTSPSKKRKFGEVAEPDTIQIRSTREAPYSPESSSIMSQPPSNPSSVNSPKPSYQSGQHIGLTTHIEPILLEHLPLDSNNESVLDTARVRRFAEGGTFMRLVDSSSSVESHSISLDAIENLVAPYGSTLVEKFFRHIHPVFPIVAEDVFRQAYRVRKGLSPLLLSAVYVLALKFLHVGPGSQTVRTPDAGRLESTAVRLLTESLPHAQLSTVQAGLLLMQKSTVNTSALNAQLVTAAFELALHLDCSQWNIHPDEKSLRKRMAWALYMQDKWCALVHGRPSQLSAANWTVKDLVERDFPEAASAIEHDGESALSHGTLLFCQFVTLTTILSDILDRFYTLHATELFSESGSDQTRLILEKAKSVQIRLKEWFSRLPPQLKMDSPEDLSDTTTDETVCNGALHLAYFATEITLHRCIVRSLNAETADHHLSHICRSAAKTRLISAMEFVNRLRPAHLKSFWPAPSRSNFALIGSFGTLLLATAPTKEEAEFYRMRLGEYRWTLSVSVKNAEHLKFALDSLDLALSLAENVPEKPGIEELMASSSSSSKSTPTQSRHLSGGSVVIRHDEDILNDLSGTGVEGGDMGPSSSSVVSGLASPVTSMSSDDEED